MGEPSIRRIHLLGFVEEVRHIHANMPDRRFCFVLGAGASKTSLIPTAGELGLEWLKKIHIEGGGAEANFSAWLREGTHGIGNLGPNASITDIANIAANYPAIYQAKWGHDRAQGHAEIERFIEAARPSYGYYALAEILASDDLESPSRHNVIITPNFDNLPAETLGALGKKIPIVIGHSAITDFARPTLRRPLIIKFHHDFLLAPKSDPTDVCNMENGYARALAEIFRLYTPIVIGYGGNDGSLMGLLERLNEESIPGGILWCWRTGDPVSERVESVVARQRGTLVEIPGFDELMTLLEKPFGHVFTPDKLSERAVKRAQELTEAKGRLTQKAEGGLSASSNSSRIDDSDFLSSNTPSTGAESAALLDALNAPLAISQSAEAKPSAPSPWWHWQKSINDTDDDDEKEKLFNQGLVDTQNSVQLLGNFASFLANRRKDYKRAEEYYLRALAADPDRAVTLGNYANFLKNQLNNYDKAEEFYLKAIAADPNRAATLGNYANFLFGQRKDYNKAEKYYQKALSADPNRAVTLGNYANFILDRRKDYDKAEEYYQKALTADPDHPINLGNYASFLADQKKDYDKAEEYYQKALSIDPKDVNNVGNYATFLADQRKDYDKAEEYFKKALSLDPNDANCLGNYASFLSDQRKDYDKAEEYYQKALSISPNDSHHLGNYAGFLKNKRKEHDKAEECYQKALSNDPDNASILGNYANFLKVQREDHARAEEYYKKAIGADPDHANNLGNYANFLKNQRRDFNLAEKYYLKALSVDPNHANNLRNYADLQAHKQKAQELMKTAQASVRKSPPRKTKKPIVRDQ